MDISQFLARTFGIIFIIVYGGVLTHREFYRELWLDLKNNPISLMLSGFLSLLLGVLVVQVHNIWTLDWRIIVTLLGWLMILQGVMRIVFPETALRIIQKIAKAKSWDTFLTVSSIIMLLLGVFLAVVGFM